MIYNIIYFIVIYSYIIRLKFIVLYLLQSILLHKYTIIFILYSLYPLIFELHKVSPLFLMNIIPNLCTQLQVEDEEVRSIHDKISIFSNSMKINVKL